YVSHRVDEIHGAGARHIGTRGATPPRRASRPRQVVQVRTLVVVQVERTRDGVDHRLRRIGALALLQARVVRRADAGKLGQLLAGQPRHATRAVRNYADVLWAEARPTASEELSERAG